MNKSVDIESKEMRSIIKYQPEEQGATHEMATENLSLRQQNDFLRDQLQREQRSSSGKKMEFQMNEEYLQHIIEEKNLQISTLQEMNEKYIEQIKLAETKNKQKKQQLEQLYQIITEKDREFAELKLRLEETSHLEVQEIIQKT